MKVRGSLFLFFALSLLVSLSSGEFVKTVYTSVLSVDAVVPGRSDTGGSGIAVCIFDRNRVPMTVDCEVQFDLDSVHGPFSAAIYLGNQVTNGEALYTFTGEIVSNFRQIFPLQSLSIGESTYDSTAQEKDFLDGLWYIAVTSDVYPLGAIRGSLLHEYFIFSRMESSQVLPPLASDSIAHGVAIGSYSFFTPFRTAEFIVYHDIDSSNNMHINQGKAAQVGISDYVFSHSSPILRETVSYSSGMQDRLLYELQYLQVDSIAYPLGEIRGELQTIDFLPEASFTARLSGSAAIPAVSTLARGCGIFYLNCHNLKLEYLVYHDVDSPTEAWMNIGDRFSEGAKIWPLARAEGPIYGARILTADEVLAFYSGRLFVSVESSVYPQGEIRGQISDMYNFFAYLTGSQLSPPVTTSGVGCATFRLDEKTNDGRILNFDVNFNLSKDGERASVDLMHGDYGVEGEFLYSLGSDFRSSSGTSVFLSNSEVNYVGTEKTYIRVGTSAEEGGVAELRGQIIHLSNPCPFVTSLPDANPQTPTSSWDNYEIPSYFEWNAASSLLPSIWMCLFACVVCLFL